MMNEEKLPPNPSADLDGLFGAWGIEARSLRRTNMGLNNQTILVDSAAGQYYLRIYRSEVEQDRVRYEHELLLWLEAQALPFQVPAPVRLPSGETYLWDEGRASETAGASAAPVIAALFREIPGEHRQRKNLSQVENAGRALAQLDTCLGLGTGLPSAGDFATFGALGLRVSLARGFLKGTAELPGDAATKQSIQTIIGRTLDVAPSLYETLPTQVIHADFSASNTLFVGDQVSGILDFEYALPDLRALDFASGLEAFCFRRGGSSINWKSAIAFCQGFRQAGSLTAAEVEALPELLRLRSAVVLGFWLERWREGTSNEVEVSHSVIGWDAVDQWLVANGDELVGVVGEAATT